MSDRKVLESRTENLEQLLEEPEASEQDSGGISRRKFLAAGATVGTASLSGCVGPAEFDDYGEFRIGIRDNIPVVKNLPFVEYYSPPLEQMVDNIDEVAENEINGRSVAPDGNRILMGIDYYTDDEILSLMEERPGLVEQEEEVTRLIDWRHYSVMTMGIEAGGAMKDIQQYLEKDLQRQYANNAAVPFYQALNITYDIAEPRLIISEESDERDDQFIGMNLYMLGDGDSRAGRYFNATEIKRYSQGSLENLREDLEQEAIQEGGFSFFL